MDSSENGEREAANRTVLPKCTSTTNSMKLKDFIPLYNPTAERRILDQNKRNKHFLDFLKAYPSKDWLIGRISTFSILQQTQTQSLTSNSPPPHPTTSAGTRRRQFRVPFIRKISWEALITYCKNWVKHPMNIALLIWLFFVATCLVILFLFMTGLLNHTIPKNSVRKRWTEIVNQILNALFTIMCLYQHPRIAHHLVLLCRWRPADIVEARTIYCKNGTPKPHERAHMFFVVILLHLTCLSQYGYCSLYWAYTSKTRPTWPQILFIASGTAAPVIAGLYTIFSPLGRKTEAENDEESQQKSENEMKLHKKKTLVNSPQWVGGIFDCWDDLTVAYLSFFCTFCVFGWNMERLGFGNMYVHIFTFILLCSAPLWVFSVTALNINDEAIMYVVGGVGIVLCLFGFLYGGFWRIQIRKRFKLPADPICNWSPNLSDFMRWLFCWSCSLAQEVRTGNFFEAEDDGFYGNGGEQGSQRVLEPLPRENGAGPLTRTSLVPTVRIQLDGDGGKEGIHEAKEEEEMRPPLQPLMMC